MPCTTRLIKFSSPRWSRAAPGVKLMIFSRVAAYLKHMLRTLKSYIYQTLPPYHQDHYEHHHQHYQRNPLGAGFDAPQRKSSPPVMAVSMMRMAHMVASLMLSLSFISHLTPPIMLKEPRHERVRWLAKYGIVELPAHSFHSWNVLQLLAPVED